MSEPAPRTLTYVRWLGARAGVVLVGSVVLALLGVLSLFRLEFDVGLVSMLPRGAERFADYQRFVERFGAQDLVIALVRAPDPATARTFGTEFAAALEERPEIADVRARVDREAFLRALGEGALPRLMPASRRGELERRLSPENVDAAVVGMRSALSVPGAIGLRSALVSDPLGLAVVLAEALAASRPDRALAPGAESLTSTDGRKLLLLIRPFEAGYDLQDVEQLALSLEAAERVARDRFGNASAVTVDYTGAFAHAREDAALLHRDISLYIFLALVGVLAVFYAGYRDLRILPFVTYHLSLTTLLTLALGIVLLGKLNLISLAFAAIFYGLGIDAAIHFYTRFLEERVACEDPEQALSATIDALLPPTLLATATTAIAFGAVGFSSLEGVAQLGWLTAIGLLLNVPGTFVVMAALLLWFERRGRLARVRAPTRATWLAAVAVWVARHRRVSVPVVGVLFALSAVSARHASIDTDLFHLRPAESRARSVEKEIQREFGFTDPHGSVLVETRNIGDPDAIDSVVRVAEIVTESLRGAQEAGDVRSVTSLAPLLPSRTTQRERLDAWAALPREAAADRLEVALDAAGFRTEMFASAIRMLREVPAPADPTSEVLPGLEILIERQLERDDEALSILVSFTPTDAAALERVADRLVRETVLPPGVSLIVTGRPLMEAELGRSARRELLGFLGFVLACTVILIGAHERRVAPTLALLAIPVGSVVGVLGLAGFFGIPLTPVSVVVLPLTIGIGLDDCLYLVERYRESGDVGEAVARGGRALSITTATTIAGFGALALSRYPALSGLGTLAAVSLAICLATTIVLLPALLSPAWLRRSREDSSVVSS
ncbi:MAG: MMPL family transporter [Candidatus Binatia bacterium]|nr:MMPL family transporter [Candidatus Binatia bacterium]